MFSSKRMISLVISCVFVVQILTSTLFNSSKVEAASLDGGYETSQSIGSSEEESKESTRKGDVDGNGEVTSIDFARMRMKLLGLIDSFPVSNGTWASDVSGDGVFNSIDFAFMRQYILGIITKFPAEANNVTPTPNVSITPTSTLTDTEPPSKPTGLNYSLVTGTSVSIYWGQSTDSDLKDYAIFKNGEFEVLTAGETKYTFTNLIPNETYEFKVCAIDTSNNKSEFSDAFVITTKVSNMEELKMALIRNFYDKGTTYSLTYDGDTTDLETKVNQAILDAVNESNEPFMLLGDVSWNTSGYLGNLQITFDFVYDDKNEYMIVARSTDELKRALLCGFYNRNQNINIIYKGTITESDISEAENSILNDDTYLNACIDNFDYTIALNQSMGITAIRFNCSYKTTKEQEEYIDSTIEFIVSKLTNTDMTDDEKEKLIHDYILTNIEYSEDDIYGNPYSALCYGKTKCDGYAMLTYKMLKAAGIENIIVTNENHAWNVVKINDKWYHLDTTWDDSREKDNGFYKYYNLTDAEILESRNYSNSYGKECISNYIADLSERNIENSGKYGEILKEIQQNEDYVFVNSFKNNASLNLLYNEVVLKEGENISLVDYEIPAELYENSYQWSSSNSDLATVANGVITAKKAGTVMISAQSMYGMFYTSSLFCKVHVMPVESGDGKTPQVLSQEKISGFTDPSVKLQLTINSKEDINSTTAVTNATDLLSGKIGFIGEPVNITTTSKFNWAEIGFKLGEEPLANVDIKDLVIYWYDEESGTIVPQATMVDEENGVISATVTHFSTYFVASKQVQNTTTTIAFVIDSKYSDQASLNTFKTNIYNTIIELRKKSNIRTVFIDAQTNESIYNLYVPAEGIYTGEINISTNINSAFNYITPGWKTPSNQEILGTVSSGMASGNEELSSINISGVKNSKYVLIYTRWNGIFVDNNAIQIKMGDTIGLIVGKTVGYYAGGAISYNQTDIIPLVEFLLEGNYTQLTSSNTNKTPWVLKVDGNNIENDVIVLQKILVSLGLLEMPIDPNTKTYVPFGTYAGLTENAVKKFQKKNGLDQDGKVGKITWNKLMLPWDENSAQPDRNSWSYIYILQNDRFYTAIPQVTLSTPTKGTKIKVGEPLRITANGTNCHHLAVFINGEWKLTVYGGSNTTTINLVYDYVIPEIGTYTVQVKGRNVPGSSSGTLACSEIVEIEGSLEDEEAEEDASEVFRFYFPETRGDSPATSANTNVTPEVAIEVLKNLSKGELPWRPELSENGGSAFFTTEGNPYTGIDPTKNFKIDVELVIPQNKLVFDEQALLQMYNKHKEACKIEAETKFRNYKNLPSDTLFNSKNLKAFNNFHHKFAERLMWNEVGEKVRKSSVKVGEVVLKDSFFSKQGDGKFVVVADASKIKVKGGIARLSELVEARGVEAEPVVIEAAEAMAKKLKWTGRVKTAFRYGGKILMVVGIAQDVYNVYVAEDKVKAVVESAGGWAGASAGAAAFAAWWTPADVAGPWAWVVHGVGTLVAGGVGYWVGSGVTRTIYELVLED
ncbi:dockerin type I domain-containing protein [Acetivibrio cellulolyticus]|uniref:dockerin type I domain-containing protein n=1 Tax=Acetivibrio cellulolyticus TaxID=35830 RepID=UPI0001E3018C|nr:dockerin type I domain-containing protein [Acetivibrio cellulolyticus]